MSGLTHLQKAIQDVSDPMVVMRRVVDQALTLIAPAEGAVVELARDGHLIYACAGGTLAEHVGTRLALEESLSGLAVRTGETLYCEDSATDRRVDGAACRTVDAVSMVCVPLRRAGQPFGVLKVTARLPQAFSADDVATLAKLAQFISIAVGAVSDISRVAAELLDDETLARAWSDDPGADRALIGDHSTGNGIGEFVANVLRPGIVADLTVKRRIERVLAESSLTMLCQPITDLESGKLIGAEALARIQGPPQQPPDAWFDQAEQVGLGVQLQLAAVQMALELLDELPGNAFLAINVGPDAITTPELSALLRSRPAERIVLELTEHLKIDDYPHLQTLLRGVRERGIRLAIDDTGAGFASLGHIVNLAPDLIKLDRQFTRGIDLDPVRRALATALVNFAQDTGAQVIAEGIETADELDTVRQLGIPYGQGYFIGRPAPPGNIVERFSNAAGRTHAKRRRASQPRVPVN